MGENRTYGDGWDLDLDEAGGKVGFPHFWAALSRHDNELSVPGPDGTWNWLSQADGFH